MPFAVANGIRLYYEVHGRKDAPWLTLIEGLGYASWMWFRQVPDLAQDFRLLVYDNRGVGRSQQPPGPYTTAQMADDLAGLLDVLGVASTHVLGASLGGMIAQSLALQHPARVERLVLLCTQPGGPEAVPMPAETAQALSDVSGLTPEQIIRRNMPFAFSPGYLERCSRTFDQIVAWRLALPQPRQAWLAQAAAGATHDVAADLHRIDAPTLILHGADDRVLPVANAHLLAQRLPNARLRIYPGQGHLFFIEQAGMVNQEIRCFLKEREAT